MGLGWILRLRSKQELVTLIDAEVDMELVLLVGLAGVGTKAWIGVGEGWGC